MESSTRTQIMTVAERLLRTRGYSDFSYADIVEQVGIRKPSIHHHFPTKEELGVEVVSDYMQRFKVALDQITNRHKDAPSRLRAYAELFSLGSKDEMFPLCTALAAELGALPERMRTQTVQFFNIHLAWLEKILDIGSDKNELELTSTPEEAAIILLSALEGGAVVGWALSKPEIVPIGFHAIVKLWSQAE